MLRTSIDKYLSPNDTGQTATHQAGLLIPKDPAFLAFFPRLDVAVKNPRAILECTDPTGRLWLFNYIYYNNALFSGTRNEYRLTGMTRFLREAHLRAGDLLRFVRTGDGQYVIEYERLRLPVATPRPLLKLGSKWKIITIKR